MNIHQVIVPPDAVSGVAMHCGVNGHNKDWIGFITESGYIHTAWGAAGGRYQTAIRSSNRSGYDQLIKEKVSKGYIAVDSWFPPEGWDSEVVAKKTAMQQKATAAMQQMVDRGHPPIKPAPTGKLVDITKGIKPPDESIGWDF